MSLQTILSVAESVSVNDHKFVGQMMSRNMRISTSQILTVQPFQFGIKPMNYLLYSQNRAVLSTLRQADRVTEQYLNFGSTGWLNYIAYQGSMTQAQIIACQVQTSSVDQTIVLGALPSISASAFIVKVGDFIQIGRYAYIATADVLRGSLGTVNIPVHRTLLSTVTTPVAAVIGQYGSVTMGAGVYTGVTFPVVVREYPTYTLMPMTNDSFLQWGGEFSAVEVVL